MTTVASTPSGGSVTPAGVHVRPLYDLFRPLPRRAAQPLETPAPHQQPSVWEALSLVLNQQLGHDAMLLWHLDRRRERLHLVTAAPGGLLQPDLLVSPGEHLLQLGSQGLEIIAHVHCALSECPLEQTLWELDLHSGLTALLYQSEHEAFLVTFGFRQRWQLVAHHATTTLAVMNYLKECRRLALPGMSRRWWELSAQVPHLWRQPYRPSALRTLYDLNQTLADVSDRLHAEETPDLPLLRPRIGRLAHKGADLMARLESVYLDSRPTLSTEELLSEALLLVRGAYQLLAADWPGCLAATTAAPQPQGSDHAAVRHGLIDWVLNQVQAEARELGRPE